MPNDSLKGQHKVYAETGHVEGEADSFGTRPHNHRDGGVNHNDGGHRDEGYKLLRNERRRGQKPGRGSKPHDFHRNPSWPTHGPFGE